MTNHMKDRHTGRQSIYSNDEPYVPMPKASDVTSYTLEEIISQSVMIDNPRESFLSPIRVFGFRGIVTGIRLNYKEPLEEYLLNEKEPTNEGQLNDKEPANKDQLNDKEPAIKDQLNDKEPANKDQLNDNEPANEDQLNDTEPIVIKPEETQSVDKSVWISCNREADQFGLQLESIFPGMFSLRNAKEYILLVIDRAQDKSYTPFTADDDQLDPLAMLKLAAITFIKHKKSIDEKHEYAIAVLNTTTVSIIHGFTNDIDKLEKSIHTIEECAVKDTFNMNLLFEKIRKFAPISPPDDEFPKFVTRTVLFYGRSYTVPKFVLKTHLKRLLANPFFIVDIVVTHEPVSAANKCDKIFEKLQLIDKKPMSYFLLVSRDFDKLFRSVGRLLGHPLQRRLPLPSW